MNNDTTRTVGTTGTDANRDPLTGAPGSHPVGTGLGAAAGGDIGSHVSRYLGLDHPDRVVAVHRTDAGVPVQWAPFPT